MNKNILIQYSDVKEEIKDIRRRIQTTKDQIDRLENVADSVKGTRSDGTIGSIKITGFPDPRYKKLKNLLESREARLKIKEMELLELMNASEEYIESIQDSELRMMLRLYYTDDLTWNQVAWRMNRIFSKRKYTENSCRMKHNRFFDGKDAR